VLYLADYAQRAGSGTIEMMEQCKAQHTPEPEFVLIRNKEFRTIMPRDYLTEQVLSRMGLNERQVKAIKLIKEKRAISLSDIQVFYVTTTRKTLYRDLQNLVDKGLIKAQGDRKGRKYAL
jgi:ATP-dependent DNA helicase RecG